MNAASRTHIGLVRASNQDALLLQPGKYGLYGVADGMGGHKGGDIASMMAVSLVKRFLSDVKPTHEQLRKGIEEANQMIYEEQLYRSDLDGMGTTLTVIWEDKNRILLGHVGDSRAYLLRDQKLRQVSQDHSMVAEMVRDGLITEEEARRHPYRNIITRALGTDETVDVDVTEIEKRAGDIYLICSDGLSEYVREEQMRQLLLEHGLEEAADLMLNLALKGGGRDNISLVIAEVTA
ncbi:MAG: Stp1/IreP family PP2C-type Ser/Thr phosphatase [Clostridia bacterium]|nr:Stp1/IreP family PP2C-type Ser/Thr phosphatase [Clostridia bacterium]